MGHHPSIVVWSGCNECNSIGHLIDVVAQEDQSRAIRAASPSHGFGSGVHTLTDHPTGGPLGPHHHLAGSVSAEISTQPSRNPRPHHLPWGEGESHGPYAKASMWPAVNGGGQGDGNGSPGQKGSTIPMAGVQPGYRTGTSISGYFVSETGATTMSSFESMSATLSPEHWALHSAPMRERNCA